MIRTGIECDVDAIVSLSRKFWKHTVFDEPFDSEHLFRIVKSCVDNGLVAVIDKGGIQGFIVAVSTPLICSRHSQMATEVGWWVEPEFRRGRMGIKLVQYMEDLCRKKGIKYLVMMAMESSSPETASRIYEYLGYRKIETSYMRAL